MHSKIVLVRHMETVSNEQGLFGDGELDAVASELGERQLGVFREDAPAPLDCAISGSQARQLLTARAILGEDFTITQDKRLNEISVGEWSGKSKKDLDAQTLADWRAGKILPPGGESKQQFRDRVLACWRELILPQAQLLVKDAPTPKDPTGILLVVTSGNPIRVIVGEVLGIPDALQAQMDVQNCSVTALRVVRVGNGFKVFVDQLNYLDHLRRAGVEVKMLPGTF